MKPYPVAIAGRGQPVSLARFTFTGRAIAFSFFNTSMKPQPIGFGLMLQLTAMAVLRDLDLTDCMLGPGSRIDRLQGDNAKTERTVLDLAYRNGQFGLGVHLTIPFNISHDAVVAAGVPMRCDGCLISSIIRIGSLADDRRGLRNQAF